MISPTIFAYLPGNRTMPWLLVVLLVSAVFRGGGADEGRASTPPRGWNSYDSFSWIVSEEEFLDNARVMADKLLPLGYQYAVLDFLWYRKQEPGASVGSPGFDLIDEWGRLVPDPARWPSSAGGRGLKAVADRVHGMGLRFGLHVMRGISAQAVAANTPILGPQGVPYEENGRVWRARDIALKRQRCGWMPKCFMSVNTKMEAGRAFLRSLYTQYAEWGVDFIKHDCVFGDDLNLEEISTVSQILSEIERPILYSISPGTHATPSMAMQISNLVNMYRVTSDDWDTWWDVQSHFDVSREFASSGLIGTKGLLGYSWPDLDMLPLGWLTDPGVNQGPHRSCSLAYEEQQSQMTLWTMAKSPLMFGGDLRHLDDTTMSLITNPILLNINLYSTNNQEFSQINYEGLHTKLIASRNANSTSELFVKVSSCHEKNINNWIIGITNEKTKEVCWNQSFSMKDMPKICLHSSTQSNVSLVQESDRGYSLRVKYKENKGQSHKRIASIIKEVCLDSSPDKASTFGRIRSNHFAPCIDHASQDWELTHDGTIRNSYTDLCVRVYEVGGSKQVDDARAWIANGSTGQFYIAFFNLGPNKLTISTKVKDVINTLHKGDTINKDGKHCSYFEVWSGHDREVVNENIVMDVVSHGCALIILTCI